MTLLVMILKGLLVMILIHVQIMTVAYGYAVKQHMAMRPASYVACFVCDLLCNLFCVRVGLQAALCATLSLCATCLCLCATSLSLCATSLSLCATCLCAVNPCQLAPAVYTCRRAPGQSAKPCPPHLRDRHRERTQREDEVKEKGGGESGFSILKNHHDIAS